MTTQQNIKDKLKEYHSSNFKDVNNLHKQEMYH